MNTSHSSGKIINLNVKVIKAAGFVKKLTGLIFRKLKENEIFLIDNCNGVHTLWMRRPIDIIFLNQNDEVVALFRNFRTFRITPFIKSSVKVIETEAGFIEKCKISCGDILNF